MATVNDLKALNASEIGDKTAPNSISPTDVSGRLDAIADELRDRGYQLAANTAGLASVDADNTKLALVENVGLFKDTATGPANGTTIFDGVGGRFWELVLSATSGATVYAEQGIEGDGAALTPLKISNKKDIDFIAQPSSGGSLPSDFTAVGSPGLSVVSGAWVLTGSPNNYSTYIRSNKAVLSERARIEATIVPNAITGTDYGIEIGFQSLNSFGYAHTMRGGYVSNAADGNYGKAILTGSTGSYSSYGSNSNTDIDVDDVIKLILERDGLLYTIKVINETKGWSVHNSVLGTPIGTPFVANNTAYPTLYHKGGSWTVTNFKYVIEAPIVTDMMIVGDSITFGQSSAVASTRWAERIGNPADNIISGGGADVTASVVARLDEIVAIKPKRVLLMIGGNDILFAISSGTWQANYNTIRDTLVDAGIDVVHLITTPRTSLDVSALRTFQLANFSKDKIIDTWTPLLGAGTAMKTEYNADGTHPNDAGASQIVATINDFLSYPEASVFAIPKILEARNGYLLGTTTGASDGDKTGGLVIRGLNSTSFGHIGYDVSRAELWINALTPGTAYRNITIGDAGNVNVGIGRQSPDTKLHVQSSTAGTMNIAKFNHSGAFSATQQEMRIEMQNGGTTSVRMAMFVEESGSTLGLRFYTFLSTVVNSVAALSMTSANAIGVNIQEPLSCAAIDINHTTRGLLLPRLTQTQRDAITSPVAGLMVYQTNNTPGVYQYNGTSWEKLIVSSDALAGTGNPTATGVANYASSSSLVYKWSRVGNIVTMTIQGNITATAGSNTLTQVGITLPVASAFTASNDAIGSGQIGDTGSLTGVIVFADATNDRLTLSYNAPNTNALSLYATVQYEVK